MLTNSNTPLEKRADFSGSERTLWRSLIRVQSVEEDKKILGLVIPGWNPHETIYFNMCQIPKKILGDIKKGMKPNYRFYARVNIGAQNLNDIYIDLSSYERG